MCMAFGVNRSFSTRRGLQYLRHAAAQQTIMDGQCSIDTDRFEIMTHTMKDVCHTGRSLNNQNRSNQTKESTRPEFPSDSVFNVADLINRIN